MAKTTRETRASPLAKALTGIEGFDEITGGGLPRGRTSLLIGEAGAGKTVFALQSLVHGARSFGEPGIFVAFEEDARRIVANAATFGWDLPHLQKKNLFFLDARIAPETIQGGGFDLTGLILGLGAQAKKMGARRIVIDGLDVLLRTLSDPEAERREVYRLHDFFVTNGLTGIITAKAERGADQAVEGYGFLQFMLDCTVLLRHYVADRVSLRELQVLKYRGSSFAENAFPMSITRSGVEVAGLGSPGQEVAASVERVSTGVERLDTMLNGGFFRGSSILISGSPGSAKSTLAGAFLEAACRRGERSLYISFDERETDIARNLSSVGIHLEPHVKSGTLHMYSPRTETKSAEEHVLTLIGLIREHRPICVVVDPLSAMVKASGHGNALDVAQRLLRMAKGEGITMLSTSLLERSDGSAEETKVHISTIADARIHLSYVARGGERNRALTICKSRGMGHSNQVRELVLSDQGITLTDVYVAGGEVLMGTARWEKEAAESAESGASEAAFQYKQASLVHAEAEAKGRLEAIQLEVAARRAELRLLLVKEQSRQSLQTTTKADLSDLRRGDKVGRKRVAARRRRPPVPGRKPRRKTEKR